ncbi:MAG: DsbA family protein [Pseudomonadota bacterium]
MTVTVDFYYGLSSRYSYLAATQIEALEADYDIDIVWHPIKSSALMDAREQNPFTGPPASGQYDWDYRQRDAEEWAALYGVPFVEPVGRLSFDRDLPSLACLAARRLGAVVEYSHEVFRLMFVRLGDEVVRDDYVRAADDIGLDNEAFVAAFDSDAVKQEHQEEIKTAKVNGVFGVPTFLIGGRLIWGNDRLPLVRGVLEGRI